MSQTAPVLPPPAQTAPAAVAPTSRLTAGWWLREAALHLVLLVVVALATLLGANSRSPIVVDAAFRPERVFTGFDRVETNATFTYRWTLGAGTVCYEQLGFAPRQIVRVTLLGDGSNAIGVEQVQLAVDGQPLATARVRPPVEHIQLLVDGAKRTGEQFCVTLTSDVAPALAASGTDRRLVGVPFERLVLAPATGTTLPTPRQLGLNLVAAVVLFWALRGIRFPLLGAWAIVLIGALAIGAGVYAGVLTPGSQATRNLGATTNLLLLWVLAGAVGVWGTQRLLHTPPAWIARYDRQLVYDLLLMLLWSGVLWGSVRLLQIGYGHRGAWPLKSQVWIQVTPWLGLAVAIGAAWIALVLRGLQQPTRAWLWWGVVGLGAVLLPVLVKASTRGWDTLFWTFRDNPSDYIVDVPRVSNPISFLGQYVAISPTLAWHNANHPPGSVLLLWGVAQVFGAGPYIGSYAAIVLSSTLVFAAWWLGLHMGGLRLALLSAALMTVMPGHMIYSVTAMDGLFNGLNALALVAFFVALERPTHLWRGVIAGGLIALAFMFTYATTQLIFFGVVVAGLALWRGHTVGAVLRQGVVVGAVFIGGYVLLYLGTGFNMIDAVLQGKANNARLLSADPSAAPPTLMGFPPLDHYVQFVGLNIVPFLWYLAPWGLAALTPIVVQAGQRLRQRVPLCATDSLALALLGLLLGMWLSGLFVREVERIWGFVYAPAAVLIGLHIWQGATQRVCLWRAGLWLGLFFGQAVIMRIILYTFW